MNSIINYNNLQCVQRHAFTGLKNLRVLSLHENQISMIPEGSFNDLQSITHMYVLYDAAARADNSRERGFSSFFISFSYFSHQLSLSLYVLFS